MATYVLGDIHGCYQTLRRLCRQFSFNPAHDRLWFVGDLVNRGPSSGDVLRWIVDHRDQVTVVLGNHDLHFLSCAAGINELRPKDTLSELLDAPDCATLARWLTEQPLMVRDGAWILVHAGVHPRWSFAEAAERARHLAQVLKSPRRGAVLRRRRVTGEWHGSRSDDDQLAFECAVFTRMRLVTPNGSLDQDLSGHPSEAPPPLQPWFAARRDDPESTTPTILFGHWSQLGHHVAPQAICLDSGCVWGRGLTAMRLEDRRVYFEPTVVGEGRAPNGE